MTRLADLLSTVFDRRYRPSAASAADDRTLQQLGRHVGASERTLQRLFRRETGTTFGRWRTQLRLQHAIVALGQDHSVTSAAAAVGYREPSAFIASFRRTFGTTPTRYLDRAGSERSPG